MSVVKSESCVMIRVFGGLGPLAGPSSADTVLLFAWLRRLVFLVFILWNPSPGNLVMFVVTCCTPDVGRLNTGS